MRYPAVLLGLMMLIPAMARAEEALLVRDADALRQAVKTGGIIHVAPGRYLLSQPLLIDRPVQLTMQRGALLVADWDADASQSVVQLVDGSSGSELRGLTIDGQDHRVTGLIISNVADVYVRDLNVSNVAERGLDVVQCQRIVVQDAQLTRIQLRPHGGGSAARMEQSSAVVLERLHIREVHGKGIGISRSTRCTVRDSIIHDTQYDPGDGIHFNIAHHNLVENCHIIDPQGNALKISRRSSHNKVRNCTLHKTRGVGYALHIQGGVDSQVTGSHLFGRTFHPVIRVAGHPIAGVDGPALRNLIAHNHLYHANPERFIVEKGDQTLYVNNVEVTFETDEADDTEQ